MLKAANVTNSLYKYYAKLIKCIFIQIDDLGTPVSHHTFNIICKMAGVSPSKAREAMDNWVEKHIDWVKDVTRSYFEKKNIKFERFLEQWLHPQFPLSIPGILIMSRAYKLHTAVFFNDHFWTTWAETNLNKVSVFLLYRGNLVFEDSRHMTNPEAKEWRQYFQKLEKYYDHKHTCDALEHLKEHAKKLKEKSKPQKSIIESDIEELSEVSGDIMPEVGDETEGEEDQPEEQPTKSAFRCSECECAKRFAKALNCAKCSKCLKAK